MRTVCVEICMGSSCHARGNYEVARLLSEWKKREPAIRVVGSLCQECCSEGPVVRVNGRTVSSQDLSGLKDLITRAMHSTEDTPGEPG